MNETRVDAHVGQKDEGVIALAAVVTAGSEMPHMNECWELNSRSRGRAAVLFQSRKIIPKP